MRAPAGREITLRLTILDPLPGVVYSLQTKANAPIRAVTAEAAPLAFDVPVRVADGPRFLGEFVRSEGPVRRFIYIAIGAQAGDPTSPWDRRAKIDIHDLPEALLTQALASAVLEAPLPGRAGDGGPACATVRPAGGWRVAG